MINNDIQKKFVLGMTIFTGLMIIKSWIQKWLQGPPKIIKLIIYPIKSIEGVEVDHLDLVDTGVEYNGFHDRSMVLVNEKNILLTQRNQLKLASIKLQLKDQHIIINAPEMETTLKIPYFDKNLIKNEIISFEIWGQITEGYVCQQEYCDWFSKYLNIKCKLLRIGDNIKYCHSNVLGKLLDNNVVYQDGFPMMLINQCSIDDLNKRLMGKLIVDHRNFRPNILVDNADPYEEDEWKKFQINNIEFNMPKPCDRCIMTTIDRKTLEKHPDNEPLKTLRTYRIDKNWNEKAPIFGINLIANKNGKIFIDDQLQL